MQITRSNFKESLPIVTEAIDGATFLAIDAEFSGLDTGQSIHSFDSLSERYLKQRKAAKAYIIVQFGLSAFQYNPGLDRYEVHSFNFYVCPRPYNKCAPDVRYQCQSSSIDFLSSQGLDFNKVFREGISYLMLNERQSMLDALKQRQERHNVLVTPGRSSVSANAMTPTSVTPTSVPNDSASPVVPAKTPPVIPEQHQTFVTNVLNQVGNFMEKHDTAFLDLEPCNSFFRRLIYQSVQHKYGKKVRLDCMTSDHRQHIRVTFPKTPEEYEQMEKDRQNAELEELEDAAGFSKVINLISQSGKLVVGHNMILDMLHIIEHFVSPLPEVYEEFKDLVRCVFPRLLDTKLLASSEHLKDFLPNTTLAEMQKDLEKTPFAKPKVVSVGDDVAYSNEKGCLHEAGYDSYITGLCFISMTDYLGSVAKPRVSHVEVDSTIVRRYWNKLFLMRMTDLSFMNLEGPDAKLSRDHVFHLTFPKGWKGENITQLFSSFGNVQIAWLDDTSAFVGLYKRDLADVAFKSLTLTPDRVYRLLTYNQFSTLAAVDNTSTGHSLPKSKRKSTPSETPVASPTPSWSRKKSGRFSLGSIEIPPIPEEDVEEPRVETSAVSKSSQTAEVVAPVNKKIRLALDNDPCEDAEKLFEEPKDW